MEIKILGSGCANCKKLEANAKEAVTQTGLQAQITKVEDFADIMKYGVMRTPALVINEKVRSYGKVLLAIFVAIVGCGIIFTGYLFNFVIS